ncbi:glycosyltransferase [Alicyclobacillus sp. TC]|uniref:Glycosyltransferase, catalytic subunit of cellulose synthase and poly-beta-1,6-N-acetylglucosamine synthase n=1 Tax=Alicyclobacillus tolerans TaxID=90970 RepID=A0A1M6RA76_9BACL|nr:MULTISPECIES: glycosyltransferase family 2 protein [Alicyclobacillus]QRF22383.1 glycosyltransferase [Alicyclobacillus sp. TC]SHK29383.1 Glycosyltransferase, catalytic subunit of cellulose synthase and poly-beta-1,6-N-acetylglucosamine synthase [Alicyclobacillus montanus]
MSVLYALLGILYIFLQVITGVIALYQLAISLFGFRHRRMTELLPPQKKFAVIIPAHNEERVVGPLIESIKRQNYPDHLYSIHLIADNCTDHTADVGKRHGAIVHQRTDNTHQGKGYAIEWMLEQLELSGQPYDAVVMFDADNLVDKNFLNIMNDKLCRGHKAIQGYLGVKNPFDTWVSVSLAVSYWYDNRMWQNARQNLGLACALGGTGLCIDYSLLQSIGWNATGLTEDLEFGVRCVEHGVLPIWAHDAIVYDEKPTDFIASFRQRLRWQQGHFQCAKQYMMKMLKEGIRERNLIKFDTGLYLFQPMRALIIFATSLFMFVLKFLVPTRVVDQISNNTVSDILIVVSAILFLQIPLTLFMERKNWRSYFALAIVPLFLWTWGPVTLHAYLTRNNRKWYHTIHKRSIRLDEINTQ